MSLKLLLVSVVGTIANADHKIDPSIIRQFAALTRQLHQRGVRVALWSNREWTYNRTIPLQQYISDLSGVEVKLHGWRSDGMPSRRLGDSVLPVLAEYDVSKTQTILLGGTDEDMRAGVNNGILHIRADWYGQLTEYGFSVLNVSDLARFCFIFALREHPLFFSIGSGALQFRSAGPFSTMVDAYSQFGQDAKSAAKLGAGHPDFWFYLAVSTLYFGGIISDVDYICTYPGHQSGSAKDGFAFEEVLVRLGKCFRISFFHDLIVRHSTAVKSQSLRSADRKFSTQLSSIHLNRRPCKDLGAQRKTNVDLRGKKILVVDDFCTSGRSLEAARAYIEAAGGSVILFSWLKTISSPYMKMDSVSLQPFSQNSISVEPSSTPISYASGIVDPYAPAELAQVFGMFNNWSWVP